MQNTTRDRAAQALHDAAAEMDAGRAHVEHAEVVLWALVTDIAWRSRAADRFQGSARRSSALIGGIASDFSAEAELYRRQADIVWGLMS